MTQTRFVAGCGRSDITGEAAECGMLGYGKRSQRSAGLHLRLHARAFVIATDPGARILLVVAELPLIFDSVHRAVLDRLADEFGHRYTATNTMITATHTHCGPGGYSHHRLYNTTTRGFRPATFDAIIDGIVEAVRIADADVASAQLVLTQSELQTASVNRSRASFDQNPLADRSFFPDAIDPLTTLLRIERDGELVGAINFFATHGTSMTNENKLISSDNKGYAALSWEGSSADAPVFAFAQTNAGDMSPNLDLRPGSGPTADAFANVVVIGTRQAHAARSLAADPAPPMTPVVAAVMTYRSLAQMDVEARFTDDGAPHRTGNVCAGVAALAGAGADGIGFAGFREGRYRLLDWVNATIVHRLRPQLKQAQGAKYVVLSGRTINRFLPLVAESAPFQLIRIGDLYLLGIPAEVTIVAGLRLRRQVSSVLGVSIDQVLVCGYSNGYLHYVTTPQEYDVQRYEGGSTLFGRWELAAITQIATELATELVTAMNGAPSTANDVDETGGSPTPQRSFGPGRVNYRIRGDRPLPGTAYGDLLQAPRSRYRRGDRLDICFVGANPNNDSRRRGTYLEVERRSSDGEWHLSADDGDVNTTMRWRRVRRRSSIISISWQIPLDCARGDYRVTMHGAARASSDASDSGSDPLTPFIGRTPVFGVS